MSYGTFAAVVAFYLLGAAPDDQQEQIRGPQPIFVVVLARQDKMLEYSYCVQKPVFESHEVEVEENGQIIRKPVQTMHMINEEHVRRRQIDEVDFIDAEGTKLAGDELSERLQAGKVIILAPDHRGVHAAIRKVLAKEAVILIPRKPAEAPRPETPPALPVR